MMRSFRLIGPMAFLMLLVGLVLAQVGIAPGGASLSEEAEARQVSRGAPRVVLAELAVAPEDLPLFVFESRDRQEGPAGEILDVSLHDVSQFSQVGRIGNYPSGQAAFAASTTSCNVGNVPVPWFAPMDPRHPTIGTNLYRQDDNGRLIQIGLSFLKHGFFAADASGCGSCTPNYNDEHLNIGCQDTYGVGNNSDRTWLGPRSEVNPRTAQWDPCGSHFDTGEIGGGGGDCRRSHYDEGHNQINHLVRPLDSDLDYPDSDFFYESFYIVADDVNLFNNTAWRKAAVVRSGNTWTFIPVGSQVTAPLIFNWGDMQSFVSPRDVGDVMVASRVVDLGNGNYRYEYNVYNHTFNRAVRSFAVPIEDGVNVSGVGYHGPADDDDANDTTAWSAQGIGGAIVWHTDDYDSNPLANSLRYGTMFTFWFEADSAPVLSTASLESFLPGAFSEMSSNILGPAGGVPSGLMLEASDLSRGNQAHFRISGAEPGEEIHLLYSAEGLGRTYVPVLDLDLDMRLPISRAVSQMADSNGELIVSLRVPNSVDLGFVGIQAVVHRPAGVSMKSNIVLREIRF